MQNSLQSCSRARCPALVHRTAGTKCSYSFGSRRLCAADMPGPRSPGHAARPGDAWRTRHAQLKQRGPERRVHHDHVDLTPVCSVVGRLWHRQMPSARITQPCDVHPCDVPLPTAVCSIFCPQVVSGRRLAYPHRRHPRFFTGLRSLNASDAGPEVLGRRRVNRCAAAARTRAARLHALTVCCLNAPQDRCRVVLRLWPWSRRLSTPTPRDAHGFQRACGRWWSW